MCSRITSSQVLPNWWWSLTTTWKAQLCFRQTSGTTPSFVFFLQLLSNYSDSTIEKFQRHSLFLILFLQLENTFSEYSKKVFPFFGLMILSSTDPSIMIVATSGCNFVDVDRDTRHASTQDFFPPCMSLFLKREGGASLVLWLTKFWMSTLPPCVAL